MLPEKRGTGVFPFVPLCVKECRKFWFITVETGGFFATDPSPRP